MIKHGRHFEGIVIARIEKEEIRVSYEIVNTVVKIRYVQAHV